MKRVYIFLIFLGLLVIPISCYAQVIDLDYTAIEEAIKSIPDDFNYDKEKEGELYTSESTKDLLDVIDLVEYNLTCDNSLIDSNELSCKNLQKKISSWSEDIINAIKGLEYKPADYSELITLLEFIDLLNRDHYTDDSLAELDSKINSIDYNKNITEQADVDNYILAIQNAQNNLELLPEADCEMLFMAVWDILFMNTSLYTQESIEKINKLVSSIESFYSIKEQDKVDNLTNQIYDAINNAKLLSADYSNINKLISKTKKMDKRKYSKASVIILENTIKSINFNKTILEQPIVDEYYLKLQNAYNNLKLVNNNNILLKLLNNDDYYETEVIEYEFFNPNTSDYILLYTSILIISVTGIIYFKKQLNRNEI